MKIILVDAYNTFVTDEWINQEIYKMLEKFENQKIILTNADEEKQEDLGLVNLPYEMFTLNFSPLKSDSKYYKIFLEENWLDKDDVIYFEHNMGAVKSAKSIWINTYHYDFEKKDIEKLEKFLKENL